MLAAQTDNGRVLGWGFAGLAAASFVLIVLGALVRAHGAGLACPDWPLCFGELVPAFDLRVAFEWGHRVFAAGVTLGLAALTILVWRRREWREATQRPLVLAWSLLVAQVLLGGLTVILRLVPWSVTAHLLVGTSFCLVLLWIARDLFELSRERAAARPPLSATVRALVALTALLVTLQISLGGLVSSHAAGLACGSFPTCDGESLAPSLTGLVGLHVVHRLIAYALFASYILLTWLTRHAGRTGKLVRSGMRLVLVQIALGAANVVLRLPIEVTALHSAIAVAIVLLTGLIVREVVYGRTEALGLRCAGREALEIG
jgi:cytochrome c oxidase assembly protein subunit 15